MLHYFLGLDWGESKIGIAVADSETRMAFGLGVIKNDNHLWEKLEKIIREKPVQTIVIGVPVSLNPQEGEYGGEIMGKQLVEKFEVKVEYVNEMFTTKMAREGLKEKGMKQLDRFDDQESARILLQDWLDNKRK